MGCVPVYTYKWPTDSLVHTRVHSDNVRCTALSVHCIVSMNVASCIGSRVDHVMNWMTRKCTFQWNEVHSDFCQDYIMHWQWMCVSRKKQWRVFVDHSSTLWGVLSHIVVHATHTSVQHGGRVAVRSVSCAFVIHSSSHYLYSVTHNSACNWTRRTNSSSSCLLWPLPVLNSYVVAWSNVVPLFILIGLVYTPLLILWNYV